MSCCLWSHSDVIENLMPSASFGRLILVNAGYKYDRKSEKGIK